MKYKAVFKWSRVKSIPRGHILRWISSLIFAFAFAVNSAALSIPLTESINKTNLTISYATLRDSRDIRGCRFKLTVISHGDSFYLWYPVDIFPKYEDSVREKILTGETIAVYATVLTNSTLWDTILGQYRIVDLRTDSIVFYDLEDEILRRQDGCRTSLLVALFLLVLWSADTALLLQIYGCVRFYRQLE